MNIKADVRRKRTQKIGCCKTCSTEKTGLHEIGLDFSGKTLDKECFLVTHEKIKSGFYLFSNCLFNLDET